MAKKRQSTASSDFGRVTASVQASKAVFQEIVKEMQNLVAQGKSAKEIFDKYNEKIETNLANVKEVSKALSVIKAETIKILNNQSLTSEDAERYGRTLQAAVSLEKQLNSAAEEVKKQVQQTFVEEQRLFRLKEQAGKKEIENFEKKKKSTDEVSAAKVAEARMTNEAEEATRKQLESQKLLKAEIKEGNARRTEDVKAYYARVKDFQNKRAARQKELNEKATKEQQQLLRDEIKENNSRRSEEVKAFERRQKAFRDARVRRLKEIGQLEKQQAREREAAAKAQLEINLKMAKRGGGGFGGGTLEQERDAQKQILQEYRKRYDQQSKEYKQLTLRLLRIDESYASQIATRDRNLDKGRQDAAKREENRQKGLNRARRQVFKAELELSKKSGREKAEAVKQYYGSELKNLKIFGKENTEEYKKLYAEQLRLLKKYNKQAEAEEKAAQKAAQPQDKKGGGFLGGLRKGLNSGELGKAIGRLTGIGSVVKVLRDAFRLLRTAIVGSFQAAVDFEAQLAQLQAVTGINNDELKRLEKSVLDVAGSTKFTSEEIVQLQTELGKLGFSVQEIENSTLAVANTAQALGEKVGPVAQKIGQILKQYNLNAQETSLVSDTLVSVINSSALSFESFGTALQYIGPLAAEVGTSFQETSTAMAILADNGFTASRIGTGLRGILTELATTGKDLSTVLNDLGDAEISLSEAVDLVGKRNAAQLITLIDSREQLANVEGKYYEMGAAAIASAQQVDTFKGNMDLLKSAFNRVQIEFGQFLKVTGAVRAALKLIDEDGYNAALAMEQIAKLDADKFSQSLTKAAEETVDLVDKMDILQDRSATYTEKATELALNQLLPAQRELLESQEELEKLRSQAQAGNAQYFTEEQRNRFRELQEMERELLEAGLDTLSTDEFNAFVENLEGQLKTQVEQMRLANERSAVETEYEGQLRRFTSEREKENIKLNEALGIRARIVASEKEIKAEYDAQKALVEKQKNDLEEIGSDINPEMKKNLEDQLALEQAKLDQLDQEIKNLNNVNFSKEELFSLAQKEYELEFSNLRNSIQNRRNQLKADTDILDLKIKTNQQEIESLGIRIQNTQNEEEKKELIAQQNALIKEQTTTEAERAQLQQSAYSDVQGFVKELEESLEYQNGLWKNAGFDPSQMRIIEKASERLKQVGLNIADLELDLPESIKAADNLITSLSDRFKDKLKDGGILSPEDEAEIGQAISDTFKDFNLTDEQMEAINAYIFSGIKPGKKTKDKVLKDTKDLLDLILGELAEVAEAYNDTAFENTQNRLNAELAAIKERYKTEEDIIKSQLDNQLITESQFRTKQNELKRKQIQEENEINRKIFEAEKKRDVNSVIIDTLEALAANVIENFGTAPTPQAALQSTLGRVAIVAAGAAKADAIRRRKFFPVQFEQGGMVEGPSHADGGVPFTVQGRGGYEMEGGEFIVNKRAAAFHRSLLERINSSVKPNTSPLPMQYATGGLVAAQRATQVTVNAQTEESVNYLKAIAHATISTANDVKKPVRAVVSSKDLSNNETERRLRERNDRI